MQLGDKVTHVEFPGQIGTIVNTKKDEYSKVPIILVRWDKTGNCSRHIPAALTRVG